MRLRYYLHIDVDEGVIPRGVHDAIIEEAEPHDRDWSAKVWRYIGGTLSDAEYLIDNELPEGFAARIDDAPEVERVQL